jgi:Na+-translocating ferredoxin:NAD+ oxidoreductase subunit B
VSTSVDAIDAALPQTQCTRCGYPDCRGYAQAIAAGEADINRCPPGGAEGVARLAALTGRAARPLDPECGSEGTLRLALIDEAWCIGCTLCITACPVDCIVGTNKKMHTVIAEQCTGCELCVPACPVDCISMVAVDARPEAATGWAAWSTTQASDALQRYRATTARRVRARAEHDERLAAKAAAKLADLEAASTLTEPAVLERKRALVEAAMARARARRHPP